METRPPTPRFMEAVLGHLHTLGVDDKRIKRETYGWRFGRVTFMRRAEWQPRGLPS